jgi:hypothetical protein
MKQLHFVVSAVPQILPNLRTLASLGIAGQLAVFHLSSNARLATGPGLRGRRGRGEVW